MTQTSYRANGDTIELLPDLELTVGIQRLQQERDSIVSFLQKHPESLDDLGGHLARTVAYLRAARAAG